MKTHDHIPLRLVVALFLIAIACMNTAPTSLKAAPASDILVTPPSFDDIGQVLSERFGMLQDVDWREISSTTLADYAAIQDAKTIFINCGSGSLAPDATVTASLRRFVEQGGTLYTSDWAYAYVEAAFPGYVGFLAPYARDGEEGEVRASILDPGLRNYLFSGSGETSMDINYDLAAWAVIDRPLRGDVRVLMAGDIPTLGGQTLTGRPLAVSFPYGKGSVVYTTFHNEAQQSDLEKRLIEYLALLPITAETQQQAHQALTDLALFEIRQDINKVKQDESIQGFYTADGKRGFGFSLAWAGNSTLGLEVYKPDGTLYAKKEGNSAPLVINVPKQAATAGTWRYSITALNLASTGLSPQQALESGILVVVGIGVVPQRMFLPAVIR